MIKTRSWVNLPSEETDRKPTLGERLAALFGKEQDLASGRERLTLSNVSLLGGLRRGFQAAGISNVISLLVDRRVIYIDHHEMPDDFALLIEAAQHSGFAALPFDEMHLVLEHREAGLHTIIDVRIVSECAVDEEEMTVICSARLEELRIRPGETAALYQARVGEFSVRERALDHARLQLDQLTERMAVELERHIVGATTRREPAIVEIIRPETNQIARFRDLEFGSDVKEPSYRPVPTHRRNGAYADPFFYYYYDPYYDFTSWIMLDMMLHHGAYHSHHVHVVDPNGTLLHTGANADGSTNWVGASAVSTDSAGSGVFVSDSIPEPSGSGDDRAHDHAAFGASGDAAFAESTLDDDSKRGEGGFFSNFFGGSSSSSSCSSSSSDGGSVSSCGSSDSGSSDYGSSDSSSSDSGSSSSCGSSCSSSSCGSSCGGGGGD
jgi:hypothetical protein